MMAESCDASSGTSYWRMATETQPCVGIVGLRPPSMASLALRAIGWRSRELIIALDPRYWGQGLAQETVAAIADYEEDKKRRLGEHAVEPHRIKFKKFER